MARSRVAAMLGGSAAALATRTLQGDLLDDTDPEVMPALNKLLFQQGQRFVNYFVRALKAHARTAGGTAGCCSCGAAG